jgi:Flp pilus assembly protein TadD
MRKLLVPLMLLSLGACSSMSVPTMPQFSMPSFPAFTLATETASAEAATPPAELSSRELVGRAIDLMSAGKADEAKIELRAALEKSPKDATATRLLEQIEKDPVELLGSRSESYVVAAGDTMSGLAERHLGDTMMFYALSRYNGLASPNALSVGKTLKIPVIPGRAPTLAAAPANPAVASAADAEKANAARLQALESLNGGDVTRAVALLKEAQTLNATDTAIGRDLERALRIQSALADG